METLLLKTTKGIYSTFLFESNGETSIPYTVNAGQTILCSSVVTHSLDNELTTADPVSFLGKTKQYPINIVNNIGTFGAFPLNIICSASYFMSEKHIQLESFCGVKYNNVIYPATFRISFVVGNQLSKLSVYECKGSVGAYAFTFSKSATIYATVTFNEERRAAFDDLFNNATIKRKDPYTNGGSTNTGGGGGTFGGGNTIFGGASDSIDIPPLPTASACDAGFITLFNPSLSQLNNLASYMWSDLFSLDTFKKIFADPMDCILGLSIVPVKPASAGTSLVKIGNISTDVSMNRTSSQYVAVDCGTIDVKEYWGAYLDYAPYTQCEIYLPYVGTRQISVDDVMNKAVHVVYHVDILSGACNAYVKCGDSVLYTFVGQCSSSIPISGNDWTNVLNGAISVAGKIGLAMATGGATALMSGIGAASSIISSSKPTVERSGAMSSTGGLLGIQKPYLILTRPKQALPENQNKYTGYPSFITMKLSDCTGYTEVDSIHLENMTCTDEEAKEIENLLKSGVIF